MKLRLSYSRKKITTTKKSSDSLAFGDYSIASKRSGRITHNQLESLRFCLLRKFRKQAKFWFRVSSSTPITKKPEGVRLGIGKGPVKFYVCSVRAGQNLVEIKSNKSTKLVTTLPTFRSKLSINTFLLTKRSRWVL